MLESNGITRVVIVGGGFAGLSCAQKLSAHQELSITLIDRNNYQQFQPLLYQVATGSLSPHNAAFNLRAVLGRHANVDIKMIEVESVDLRSRTAHCSDGISFTGDVLVLAAGAEVNFFGIAGVKEHTFPLYSLTDAERLRSKLIETLERADLHEDKAPEPLRIVVVGGGATGVEIAGAVGDLLRATAETVFKRADLKHASVTLIDTGDTVLSPFSEHSQKYATEILEERGVQLLLGRSVSKVTASSVVLSDGTEIVTPLVVWAGGLKASRLSTLLGIEPGHGGRIDVQSDLGVAGFPGVYALGDFANFQTDTGQTLPQLASVAQQAGHHCARNIVAVLAGQPTKPFKYFDKGIMAMIGRNAAVAEVGSSRHAITGTIAFAAWLGVHALLLTTVRAQIETFLEWAWEYFGHIHVNPILDRPEVNWSSEEQPPHAG